MPRPFGRLAMFADPNLEGALRELAGLRRHRALHSQPLEGALNQGLRVYQMQLGDCDVVLRASRRGQRGEWRECVRLQNEDTLVVSRSHTA